MLPTMPPPIRCSKSANNGVAEVSRRFERCSHVSFGRPDCLAGHVRLELRNVVANYPYSRGQLASAYRTTRLAIDLDAAQGPERIPISLRCPRRHSAVHSTSASGSGRQRCPKSRWARMQLGGEARDRDIWHEPALLFLALAVPLSCLAFLSSVALLGIMTLGGVIIWLAQSGRAGRNNLLGRGSKAGISGVTPTPRRSRRAQITSAGSAAGDTTIAFSARSARSAAIAAETSLLALAPATSISACGIRTSVVFLSFSSPAANSRTKRHAASPPPRHENAVKLAGGLQVGANDLCKRPR